MWIKESMAFVVLRKLLFVRLIVRIGAWEPEKSGIFKNLKGMVDIMDLKDFSCMVLCVNMWFSFPLHAYFSCFCTKWFHYFFEQSLLCTCFSVSKFVSFQWFSFFFFFCQFISLISVSCSFLTLHLKSRIYSVCLFYFLAFAFLCLFPHTFHSHTSLILLNSFNKHILNAS